mmetsp:Transcript_14044/g.34637  ORF Transcript_14044/g.34637 Transcript_14044/m.34637 type:complete len:313 (-) Transcript_14044:177-1115(-)
MPTRNTWRVTSSPLWLKYQHPWHVEGHTAARIPAANPHTRATMSTQRLTSGLVMDCSASARPQPHAQELHARRGCQLWLPWPHTGSHYGPTHYLWWCLTASRNDASDPDPRSGEPAHAAMRRAASTSSTAAKKSSSSTCAASSSAQPTISISTSVRSLPSECIARSNSMRVSFPSPFESSLWKAATIWRWRSSLISYAVASARQGVSSAPAAAAAACRASAFFRDSSDLMVRFMSPAEASWRTMLRRACSCSADSGSSLRFSSLFSYQDSTMWHCLASSMSMPSASSQNSCKSFCSITRSRSSWFRVVSFSV